MIAEYKPWQFTQTSGLHPTYVDCASIVMSRLCKSIPAVFDRSGEELFEGAAEARSNVEQTRFFDGMREIDLRKARLTQAFLDRCDGNFSTFFSSGRPVAPVDVAVVAPRELRVLDDRDLAITLAVEAMIDSAENRCTGNLYALGVRLGVLFRTDPVAIEINPFAPRLLCESFLSALATLESEIEIHLSLYRAFDRELVHGLDELYDRLNGSLVEAGVAPNLKFRHDKKVSGDDAEEILVEAPEETPSQAEVPPNDHQPLAQRALDAVHGLVRRRHAGVRPAAVASTPSLLAQLDSLQSELASGSPTSNLSVQNLKSQLLKQMPGQRFSAVDEATFDLVGLMFDFFTADRAMPTPFQHALSRLQVPYLRAAIHNPSLISGETNPARDLVDELAATGIGWSPASDRGRRVLNEVEKAVEQIVQAHQQDALIQFQHALNHFRRFRQQCERRAELRAKRECESLQGRERLQYARQNVAQIIVTRTKGRSIPPLVRDLLQRAWAHVMVLMALRHGVESEHWSRALAILDELIWSVTFKRSDRESIQRLRTRLPVLARALSRGLEMVGFQATEIRKVLANLKQVYEAQIRTSGHDRVVIETSSDGLLIRGEDLVTEVELELIPLVECADELTEIISTVRSWKTGQWVVFDRDDAEPLRAKLSWVSPITGRYLFVDQRGVRAMEKSPQELAEDLVGSRVSPLNDSALVSRALGAIAEDLTHQRAA